MTRKPRRRSKGMRSLPTKAPLDALVDEVVRASCTFSSGADEARGGYKTISAICRSADRREPDLYRRCLEHTLVSHNWLQVLECHSLPLPEEAMDRARPSRGAFSVDDEAYFRERAQQGLYDANRFFSLHLVVLDNISGELLLVSISNTRTVQNLSELKAQLMAVGLVARGYLERQGYNLDIKSVRVAIVDPALSRSDVRNGIFAFNDMDQLFGTSNVGQALNFVATRFSQEIEQAIAKVMDPLAGSNRTPPTSTPPSGNGSPPAPLRNGTKPISIPVGLAKLKKVDGR